MTDEQPKPTEPPTVPMDEAQQAVNQAAAQTAAAATAGMIDQLVNNIRVDAYNRGVMDGKASRDPEVAELRHSLEQAEVEVSEVNKQRQIVGETLGESMRARGEAVEVVKAFVDVFSESACSIVTLRAACAKAMSSILGTPIIYDDYPVDIPQDQILAEMFRLLNTGTGTSLTAAITLNASKRADSAPTETPEK